MKQGERDSKQRIAFPVLLFQEGSSSAELPDELHVVPTGKWKHPAYGEMEITSANIAEFVQNFKDKVRLNLPITQGHDNGMSGGELPAIGWFKELIDRGVNGLYAVVEWTEEGKQLLQARAFKYFSPEFYEEYHDPETDEVRHHVLVGGALTNKPYFKELDPVVAFSESHIISEINKNMDLKTILSKKPEQFSEEEKEFVRAHKSELSAEQSAAMVKAKIFDEAGETDEEKAAREAKEAEEKAAAEKAAAEKKAEEERQASEKNKGKTIQMSETEVLALKDMADKGAKAFAEIEKMKLGTEVDKLVFSQTNKEGQFLPKQKDAVVAFMFSLSQTQRDQFRSIVSNIPKRTSALFTETGDDGKGAEGTAAAQINTLAMAKFKASEGKLTYSEAVKQVTAENPQLAKDYKSEVEAGE